MGGLRGGLGWGWSGCAATRRAVRWGWSGLLSWSILQRLSNPEGRVLVTGPSGSGKTTPLYSARARLNDGRSKSITADDPIEYYIPEVNQKQMAPATLLRAMRHQDPNVMLVGEVRDLETGSMALTTAGGLGPAGR